MTDLFLPDVFPQKGGIGLHQAGRYIHIPDAEVERFVAEIQDIRRRQLIADCRRIADSGVV